MESVRINLMAFCSYVYMFIIMVWFCFLEVSVGVLT